MATWSLVELYRFNSVPVSSVEPNDIVLDVVSAAGTVWCWSLALVRQKGRGSALPCTPRTFRG